MTWKQLTERDCREWKLSGINPHDRDTWRSGVISAMRAASQLPGRGPTVVDMALYLHVNQISDDDDHDRKLSLNYPFFALLICSPDKISQISIKTYTMIHRYPIFSTRYSIMCKVYTGYHGTSETEHGLCACTVDNPLAKARGLSLT